MSKDYDDFVKRMTSFDLEVESEDDAFIEDVIAHYGVLGMKWGARKEPKRTKVRVTEVPGRKIQTSGGTGQRVSANARRAAVYKQKALKSTTDSLSDQQLRTLINRMQMEKQYNDLRPKSSWEKLFKLFMTKEGQKQISQASQMVDKVTPMLSKMLLTAV